MELVGYRVCDFRSVNDSGWIETSEITAFIGTNESGKTNLLVPLWKFNPAKDGVINPIQDYPRNRYGTIREMTEKPVFIEVKFRLSNNISIELSEYTLRPSEQFNEVIVKRDYSGKYHLDFPNLVHKIEPKKKTS